MTTHVPSQVDLATTRLEQLIDGQRRTGDLRLPREVDLSEQLGISRNTLREALARLAQNGVIERRRRHGTFIVDSSAEAPAAEVRPAAYPIDQIVSLPNFFTTAGSQFAIRSVGVETESAAGADAERLGLQDGTAVYRIRRVFTQNGVSAAIGEHVLPTRLRGHELHIEALTVGISTFLSDVEHVSVDIVRHTATALAADPSTARDLGMPVGSPVLAVEAELCTRDGDEIAVVALGRLLFNPALISVSATALSGEG